MKDIIKYDKYLICGQYKDFLGISKIINLPS